MSLTVAQAILATANLVTRVRYGTADSSGTTKQLDDTTRLEPDDFYVKAGVGAGVIFFLSGTNDGLVRTLATYSQGVGFTWDTAVDAITNSGDKYAVTPVFFERDEYIQAINDALDEIGRYEGGIPQEYTNASFVTVANQMDYTLPTTVWNVHKLEIATATSAPYNYQTIPKAYWEEIGGSISFKEQCQPTKDDYLMRLTYTVPAANVDDESDDLGNYLNINLVKWIAAKHLLNGRDKRPEQIIDYDQALKESELAKIKYPIPKMDGDAYNLSGWLTIEENILLDY